MTTSPLPPIAEIGGVGVNLASLDQAVTRICGDAISRRGSCVFTLNLDHLVKLESDADFAEAYKSATYVSADGAPVVFLARRQGARLKRTAGADLIVPLCKEAARRSIPVYFFGSTHEALEGAAAHLSARFPKLKIAGMEAPPFGFKPRSRAADEAAARIAASGARICMVALGAPGQEIFAARAFKAFPEISYLGIGAALDFLSGRQSRAPEFMQHSGTEWIWRLMGNPRRMAGRYGKCALILADMALVEPLRHKLHLTGKQGAGPK